MHSLIMSEKEEETRVDWSELPYHLLDLMMDSLISSSNSVAADYISFGNVCVSWRSALNLYNPCLPACPIPLLINCDDDDDDEDKRNNKKKTNKKELILDLRRFYNIFRISGMKKLMPKNRQCRGSSHGWLITVDDDDIDDNKFSSRTERCSQTYSSIRLFNPFSSLVGIGIGGEGNKIILLPSLMELPVGGLPDHHYYRYRLGYGGNLCKAVLSADPISNPTDYMVMAIYSTCRMLAFHKPGDKSWTCIKSPRIKGSKDGHFSDLIYYQGKFFVINWMGTVVVCDDLAEGGMAARVLFRPPITEHPGMIKYLVESSEGNLLQVHRQLTIDTDNQTHSTIGFKVFKLVLLFTAKKKITEIHEIGEEKYEWVQVKSLCGDAMFLGHNASISISTIDNPGYESNCIYYMDDSDFFITDSGYGAHDMGVFDLEKGTFNRYFPTDPKDTSSVLISPNPIWIQPSLQRKKNLNFIDSTPNDLFLVLFSCAQCCEN